MTRLTFEESNRLTIGDKLICVDTTGTLGLELGKIYTLADGSPTTFGCSLLILAECPPNAGYMPWHFELVPLPRAMQKGERADG